MCVCVCACVPCCSEINFFALRNRTRHVSNNSDKKKRRGPNHSPHTEKRQVVEHWTTTTRSVALIARCAVGSGAALQAPETPTRHPGIRQGATGSAVWWSTWWTWTSDVAERVLKSWRSVVHIRYCCLPEYIYICCVRSLVDGEMLWSGRAVWKTGLAGFFAFHTSSLLYTRWCGWVCSKKKQFTQFVCVSSPAVWICCMLSVFMMLCPRLYYVLYICIVYNRWVYF